MILKIEKLNTFYDKNHILKDVSFHAKKSKITCLIGKNGSGRTTLLNSICAITKASSGKIILKGENITGIETHKIISRGLSYVLEDRAIFNNLTTYENIYIANRGDNFKKKIETIYNTIPMIYNKRNTKGINLSGGEKQILAIAKAIINGPDIILLDEPSEGLAPIMINLLKNIIKNLKEKGTSILLCEQNTKFAQSISDIFFKIEKGIVTTVQK